MTSTQITVRTRYESRPNSNVGKVVARALGRQKATTCDPALTADQYHEAAARNLLRSICADTVDVDALNLVQTASNPSGGERTYWALVTELAAL